MAIRLNIEQEEVLRNVVGRSWGGSGGPQTAMRKLQEVFPEFAPRGGFSRRVAAARTATTARTPSAVTVNSNSDDPYGIGALADLESQLSDAVANKRTELTNAIERLAGKAQKPQRSAAVANTGDEAPRRRRKRRVSAQTRQAASDRMRQVWADKKAVERRAARGKGSRKAR